jgi:peptide-methionine (S)-S-oxide reductase
MKQLILAALLMLSGATGEPAKAETAIFAGGCFWCVESDFDKVKGVTSTVSGYAGGTLENPTYKNHAGHREVVKIEFDPAVVSYETLVSYFLRTIDVTDAGGQFCDRGDSYKSEIFTTSASQMSAAEKAVAEAGKVLGKEIVTPVRPATTFAMAEDYHQNYYLGENRVLTRFGWIKQSDAYKRYRKACGRDAQVKKVWGDAAFGLAAGS